MGSVHANVHRRGGVAATFELKRDGHTARQLARAVHDGDVIRVRHGHYACPELHPLQVEAYRVGGRLTGIAGARAHGMWTPVSHVVDIQVAPDARALRTRADETRRLSETPDPATRVTWTDADRPGTRSLAGPIDCLRQVARTCTAREVFAVAESALRGGIVSSAEWRRLVSELPSASAILGTADRVSESGGESLLLYDLREVSIHVTQQVAIAGVGRVDMLLGERQIIEVDGFEFHSQQRDFEEDRRRDAAASSLGFHTLRFSHNQVEKHDPLVLAAIFGAIARGDHR